MRRRGEVDERGDDARFAGIFSGVSGSWRGDFAYTYGRVWTRETCFRTGPDGGAERGTSWRRLSDDWPTIDRVCDPFFGTDLALFSGWLGWA